MYGFKEDQHLVGTVQGWITEIAERPSKDGSMLIYPMKVVVGESDGVVKDLLSGKDVMASEVAGEEIELTPLFLFSGVTSRNRNYLKAYTEIFGLESKDGSLEPLPKDDLLGKPVEVELFMREDNRDKDKPAEERRVYQSGKLVAAGKLDPKSSIDLLEEEDSSDF